MHSYIYQIITRFIQLLTLVSTLIHTLTLFIVFRVQYDQFCHLLYTNAYTTYNAYSVVRTLVNIQHDHVLY